MICSLRVQWLENVDEKDRKQKAIEVMIEVAESYCDGKVEQHGLLPLRDRVLKERNYVPPTTKGANQATKRSKNRVPVTKTPVTKATRKPMPAAKAPATPEPAAEPTAKKARPPPTAPCPEASTASTSTAAAERASDDEMEFPSSPIGSMFGAWPGFGF